MRVYLLRQVGYCLIWADLFLVFLAGHAMLVDPAASGAQYLHEYFFCRLCLGGMDPRLGWVFRSLLRIFCSVTGSGFFLNSFYGLFVDWGAAGALEQRTNAADLVGLLPQL